MFNSSGSFLARREHLYTCASCSTAQVWHLSLSLICFYSTIVVRWSADFLSTVHWSVSMSDLIYISLRWRQSQFPTKNHVLRNAHLSFHYYLIQCNFPSHRVQIKIWVMPLFFNQRYELVPSRHVIYLLQVFPWLLLRYTAVGFQVGCTILKLYAEIKAFQVYPLWEYLGGPEKDWVLF